jgi:hypothetical protein
MTTLLIPHTGVLLKQTTSKSVCICNRKKLNVDEQTEEREKERDSEDLKYYIPFF